MPAPPARDRVDRMLALSEIGELVDRYALAVDSKDLDALVTLFVEDVEAGPAGTGRDALRAFYDARLRDYHCSMHVVANRVVDLLSHDTARGVVYCSAHHHVLRPTHWFDLGIAYFDDYQYADDKWLFRRRRVKTWYRQEIGTNDGLCRRVASSDDTALRGRGRQMPEAFETFEPFWKNDRGG